MFKKIALTALISSIAVVSFAATETKVDAKTAAPAAVEHKAGATKVEVATPKAGAKAESKAEDKAEGTKEGSAADKAEDKAEHKHMKKHHKHDMKSATKTEAPTVTK